MPKKKVCLSMYDSVKYDRLLFIRCINLFLHIRVTPEGSFHKVSIYGQFSS